MFIISNKTNVLKIDLHASKKNGSTVDQSSYKLLCVLYLFTSEQSSRTFLKNTFLITQDVSLTVFEGKILNTISIVFKICSLCSNNYNNKYDGRVADA